MAVCKFEGCLPYSSLVGSNRIQFGFLVLQRQRAHRAGGRLGNQVETQAREQEGASLSQHRLSTCHWL